MGAVSIDSDAGWLAQFIRVVSKKFQCDFDASKADQFPPLGIRGARTAAFDVLCHFQSLQEFSPGALQLYD
jgi:hypothetical protein